jgi:hypothetical protein
MGIEVCNCCSFEKTRSGTFTAVAGRFFMALSGRSYAEEAG